jgi:hypothetical protein
MEKTIKVYVTLLEEGTPTLRPTQAIDHGNGTCTLMATPKYNPESEIWEFVPGTKVFFEPAKTDENKDILLAIKKA